MPKHFSLPRNGLVLELLGNGTFVDTNDGTKATVTPANITYPACPVGYQKQWGLFNGTSGYVSTNYAGNDSSYTLSGFFQCDVSNTNNKTLVYKGATGSTRAFWGLVARNNHPTFARKLVFLFDGDVYVASTTNFDDAKQHHFVLTATSGDVKLYVDGVLEASSASITNVNDTGSLAVGREAAGADWWNGKIGAFRYHNRILSETERAAFFMEYNRRLAGGGDFGAFVPAPTAMFDMRDGSNVATAEANTPNANVTQNSPDYFGLNRCMAFNGSSSNIPLTYAANPITGNSYSYGFIFKTASGAIGQPQCLLIQGNGSSAESYPHIDSGTGKLAIGTYNGSTGNNVVSAAALDYSAWYAAVITVSGGTAVSMYYKRIDSSTVVTDSGTLVAGVTPASSNCHIGSLRNSAWFYSGSIAFVGIWDSTLTADQSKFVLSALSFDTPYAFKRSLLQACGVHAYYDGTFSGSNAYDVAGGFGTKTISGTMGASVRAQQNKAFSPAGSQYINLSGANLYNASGWWIAQWIKTTASGDTRNECNSNANGYWCHLAYNRGSAGKPESFFYDGSNKYAIGITTVNDGKWHLCIAEFVPGTHTRIWVDGRLEATTAVGTFASNVNTQQQYAFADRDAGGKVNGKADWMYGKGPMTSQKAQMLYFGTYRN